MSIKKLFALTGFALTLMTGCAAKIASLNESQGAILMRDVAPIAQAVELPYNIKTGTSFDVGMNVRYAETANTSGYIVTLTFRNKLPTSQAVVPAVSMADGAGFIQSPYSFDGFMRHAAQLAGTRVPAPVTQTQDSRYVHSGTITDYSSGRQYSYSGTSQASPSGGFASGFLKGLQAGDSDNAAGRAEEGRALLRWADAYWLKGKYELPPGQAAAGVLVFASKGVGQLPLSIKVSAGGEVFDFTTSMKR